MPLFFSFFLFLCVLWLFFGVFFFGVFCCCCFFFFFFCQAHHCGAFIQKHSSIITVFLSLTHSHVFVWFFPPHMYILHCGSSPWLQCVQFSFLSFSQLNISKLELIFKYLMPLTWAWSDRWLLARWMHCCDDLSLSLLTVASRQIHNDGSTACVTLVEYLLTRCNGRDTPGRVLPL